MPTAFLNLARRLGFGKFTGLPLVGEVAGLVPSDDWMLRNERRRILDGDTANLSIGQGSLPASPRQVAQAMAGIANGSILPKLQLIKQIQDTRGRVVQVAFPQRSDWLGVDPKAVEVVHDGMRDVVRSGGGTGHAGELNYTGLCGKTGTAQWGPPSKNQRLAWFAGYLPHDNPRYSFAVLYEGQSGETVSGGRMAAPMVRKFSEGIKDDIKDDIDPPKKALIVIDESTLNPAGEPDAVPTDLDGTTPPVARKVEGALKAIPVEPLNTGRQESLDEPFQEAPPDKPRAIRAIPVKDDEVIQKGVEEP